MQCIQNTEVISRLLEAEAKGFFFVKFALTEFTSELKLDAIMRKAHAVYDRAVTELALPTLSPSFSFRVGEEAGKFTMLIQKDASRLEGKQVIAEVGLALVQDPVSKRPVVVLATETDLPTQKLRGLSLVELKKHMEVYFEVLNPPHSVLLDRLIKTFCDIEQTDKSVYTYDLTSSQFTVGISSHKDGHRNLVLAVHLQDHA